MLYGYKYCNILDYNVDKGIIYLFIPEGKLSPAAKKRALDSII